MSSIKVIFSFWREGERPAGASQWSLGINKAYSSFDVLDGNTTYEEIVQMLVKTKFLAPLDDPRLYYKMRLEASETRPYTFPQPRAAILQEGQTLASTHIMTPSSLSNKIDEIRCHITLEILPSPEPKKKTSSTSPSLAETISTVATTASIATIIQTLIVVQERWEKTHQKRKVSTPQHFPQPGKTDIYAIRLRWDDGRQSTMKKWLLEPDELKHFIDAFQETSSKVKPTEVVFVLWNRDVIVVDATKGTKGNLQLDEMLKYLNLDVAEK